MFYVQFLKHKTLIWHGCAGFSFTTSGRFTLSGSFLSTEATQVLIQPFIISRWDYFSLLLASLPLHAIKCPTNDPEFSCKARLVLRLPIFSHSIPLPCYWCLPTKTKMNQAPHLWRHHISVKPLALLDLTICLTWLNHPSRSKEDIHHNFSLHILWLSEAWRLKSYLFNNEHKKDPLTCIVLGAVPTCTISILAGAWLYS